MNLLIDNIHDIANVTILMFMIFIAVSIITSRNLLNATFLLAVFSLLMAIEYLILGAPDVAITEAAVGAGISTILLLLAIFVVGAKEKNLPGTKLLPAIVMIAVTIMLLYACSYLPIFGASDTQAQTHVAAYYIANTMRDTGVNNVVTAILASYRGYDTLGEIFVIFIAGIAVFMLLGRVGTKKKRGV